jgi:hypothetical protein
MFEMHRSQSNLAKNVLTLNMDFPNFKRKPTSKESHMWKRFVSSLACISLASLAQIAAVAGGGSNGEERQYISCVPKTQPGEVLPFEFGVVASFTGEARWANFQLPNVPNEYLKIKSSLIDNNIHVVASRKSDANQTFTLDLPTPIFFENSVGTLHVDAGSLVEKYVVFCRTL